MFVYCGNNPVMNVDSEGNAFFTTLLLVTLAGVVIGGLGGAGKALLVDEAELGSKQFWGAVGKGSLTGGALGAAFALGGAGGAIATGKMAGLFGLGKFASIGLTFGTAVGVNFLAGMGGYAIESQTNPNMQYNTGQMFMAGIGQANKAIVNYTLGGVFGAAGFWKLGKMSTARLTGVEGILSRIIVRNVLTPLPSIIIDSIFYV